MQAQNAENASKSGFVHRGIAAGRSVIWRRLWLVNSESRASPARLGAPFWDGAGQPAPDRNTSRDRKTDV